MSDMSTSQELLNRKQIANWLFSICGLVFIMVIVGAITRLTESGLSMVEWRPLIGAIPPLTDAEWERVFDLYKQTPEFQKEHFWMNMADFQFIFFWEWFHRFLGRLIGLAFVLPLIWFWVKNKIPSGYKLPLIGLLILGGLQGYMGWFMVKSGLVDEPAVSHYRLAAHLSLAFLIFCLLLKAGLNLIKPQPKKQATVLSTHLWVCTLFLILTIFWGAYTAGLDAGLIYNDTFPKMGDSWLPMEMGLYQPYFVNFFENHAGVQFTHRWLAMITASSFLTYWIHAMKKGQARIIAHLLIGMVCVQFSLGLATLMTNVNINLAVLHQVGALVLLGLIVTNLHFSGQEKTL